MAPCEQSALWARVSDAVPAFPTPDSLQLALNRAEHERADLAESVRRVGAEAQAWHEGSQAQREDLRRLQDQVIAISRRLQRAVVATEERRDSQRDALAVLHDSSADLVDAVRSHTQRSLHELEQLRDELREASDRSAWRTRFACVGCLAACVISLAAWVGGAGSGAQVADPGTPSAAPATISPVGSTLLAGFRRAK